MSEGRAVARQGWNLFLACARKPVPPPPTVENLANATPEQVDRAVGFDEETGRTDLPQWWVPGWRNRLIWGDNRLVLSSLLEDFAGKVDLIYIDPPFATGADFSYSVQVGDEDVTKLPSMIEEVAYRDMWKGGDGSFLQVLNLQLTLLNELLSPRGSLFVHCDWRQTSNVGLQLTELFGRSQFRNLISWTYTGPSSPNQKQFSRKTDVIHWYSKGGAWTFNGDDVRIPYHKTTAGKFESEGTGFGGTEADLTSGKIPEDWWYLPVVSRLRNQILGYPTQKPEALLERIIKAASNRGDLVLDCFVGSGTTAAVAERLGRRWIGVDIGRFAVQTTRKRLLEIPGCLPFEVQNLGRYERKYWQAAEFEASGETGDPITSYFDFVLRLYGALSLHGQFAQIHGTKEGRAVHIGATDAPVTLSEIDAVVAECRANGFNELDVLGWEFEMGVNTDMPVVHQAEFSEVHVRRFRIPREILDSREVEAGGIHFFELSVASALTKSGEDGTIVITLADFTPRVDDYMQASMKDREPVCWSDWIDYWSVDFEYDGSVFVNQWQAYRTRNNRDLVLQSDPHRYESPGVKSIVVKVIDIFGNDTTLSLEHEA